jgi:hypothetical protein
MKVNYNNHNYTTNYNKLKMTYILNTEFKVASNFFLFYQN